MKAIVIIEKGSDGTYGAYIANDNLPFGVIGDGDTVAETIKDFQNSLEEMKDYYTEEGKEFPELEIEYRYDVASFLQHFAYAFTLAGLARMTGINQGQLSHYINGTSKPSKRTTAKIEKCLHDFAADLAAVKFV